MKVELDHTIVPSRDKVAAARLLGGLLGVPWAPSGIGPFAPVYVNDGLTLDFIDTDEAFPVYHFCFRVGPADFSAILERIRPPASPFAARCADRWTCRCMHSWATSTGTSPTATSGRC
jgi:hypothetical protein